MGGLGSCYHTDMQLTAKPWHFFPLALVFLASHVTAQYFYLYWYWSWFDSLMHAWGGFLTIMGFYMLGRIGSRRLALPLWALPLALGVVMLAWEVFEYVYGIAGAHPSYAIDTTLDMVFGSLGGMVAFVLFRREG